MNNEMTPFERIRRINSAGNEFWSSRDFARVLGYTDYRNFEAVVEKARLACFNSGQRKNKFTFSTYGRIRDGPPISTKEFSIGQMIEDEDDDEDDGLALPRSPSDSGKALRAR